MPALCQLVFRGDTLPLGVKPMLELEARKNCIIVKN